jgi:uncharacterized protein
MSRMTVIMKIAERCNLNCPYCYMYTGPDQGWQKRPKFISDVHTVLLVDRLCEYLAADPNSTIDLNFHGGEPLLFGRRRWLAFLSDIVERVPAGRVRMAVQTNGVLLDKTWLELFMEFGIYWSISSDGPPALHDRFRVFHDGRPSAHLVESAIRMCVREEYSNLFSGVLAVIHHDADGAQVVRYFHDLGVKGLDLLIPDAHYGTSPAHLSHCEHAALLNYLTRAFDQWISYQSPEFGIRIFEEFILGLFGRPSQVDAFGGNLSNVLVLESDGSYQFVDVLHTCGEDQVTTHMHVSRHSLEEFHLHAAAVLPKACATCRECPIFGVCGGGYLPHRFDGKGFDNPSVYCDVLYPLITYIRDYLRSVTPARMWSASTASGEDRGLAAVVEHRKMACHGSPKRCFKVVPNN